MKWFWRQTWKVSESLMNPCEQIRLSLLAHPAGGQVWYGLCVYPMLLVLANGLTEGRWHYTADAVEISAVWGEQGDFFFPQGTGGTLWSFSSKAKFQANCRSDDGADPSQEEAAESSKVCWAIGNRSFLRETLEAPGKEERPFRGAPPVDREGEGVIGTRCSLQGGMEGHCPHLHPLRYYGHC